MYSNEHQLYLKKKKKEKIIVLSIKILILVLLIVSWEILARLEIINSFISSSPSKVIKTLGELFKNNNLLSHIYTTFYETIVSFLIATILGLLFASLLWMSNIFAKIMDPYLTVLNSLPKVSLGPLIIILLGASTKSIIVMALLISLFTTIINMYNAFIGTDKNKIILMKSFNASKYQIFKYLILRGNVTALINTLKINISLTLIGVIMGELLVSKKGLGYLINYGSQIFNLNLVITSIFILSMLSYIFYMTIDKIEKYINTK